MKLFSQYRGLRRELYILFIGRMMTNMGSMIWPMFTLILSGKLGMSAATIAFYMLLFSLASIPVSLLGGKLADKLNKKNIIVVCDCVSIASYIYCSLVEINFANMVIFAIATLFQSIEWPSYDALVADFTTSADRERAYSLNYLGGNLGMVLSPTIGGILFNEHLNIAFLISGLSIALSTILIFIFIKDVHREEDAAVLSGYEQDIDSKVSPFTFIAHHRVILLYIVCMLLGNAVYNTFSYLMPLDLVEVHGENGSVLYGTITSFNCIVVVVFTAFITKLLAKYLDSSKMLLGRGLELGGLMIFAVLSKSVIMCYVSMFVFTVGEIVNTIACSPFLTRRIPASHRGRIIAVSTVVTNIGTSLLQNVMGIIRDNFGMYAAWGFVLITGLAGLVLLALIKRFDKIDYAGLAANKEDNYA